MSFGHVKTTGEAKLRIGLLTNYHLECMGGAEEAYDQLGSLWHAHGHRVTLFSTPPGIDLSTAVLGSRRITS